MSDIVQCCGHCNFKSVESQLSKSQGYCPVCGFGRPDMVAKHDQKNLIKRGA